ncbi:PREDICTED: uncharacterized protein LOC106789249 isoform X2 [Polistes canadensis]|nr:PREDICTED: uncharacterized protein LOC106789249 isoform X2 [Polistes canadensis]XP_014608802.1 PREDICTED: uncharacterized protein LOC106789249 isoform X2 [Polistes canadensis]XP_014608803.1 PREDICTED: uncharacterized protein LOC106789249 isoform X2 [Polistes canadensis]XP_014608804.1 PREDICTED: uncharacterized protein LOC106789249 isoform X2 [Polistes canadensis]
MPQESIRWQGTQRRACGPGAQWNVQVVRGKVTTRCLWHACKALGIGLLLMLLGACMATIGYYADQLSVAQEIRGNLTIKVKNESREFHLNNLSYAGPIVMGVGGFIVVAVCVMTFEARDSAAKVVPARFRFNQSTLKGVKTQRNRRSTSCQTTNNKWDHQYGLFRINRSLSPSAQEISRRQLKAELVRFSRELQEKSVSHTIKKSPSAPILIDKKSPRREAPQYSGCALLNPQLLQRHALSVDNPAYSPPQVSRESLEYPKLTGSQASMAMDLHIPNKGPVTLRVRDRSDTARRHQLLRQTKIEDVEEIMESKRPTSGYIYSPRLSGVYNKYPAEYVIGKRNSVDVRYLDDLNILSRDTSKVSPRDFRKSSSPNFRKMSLDRIGGEHRLDKSMGHRKASLEFRKSPDFRRGDYRKLSVDRFSVDYTRCVMDEVEFRSKANSGESLKRQQRYPKLHHSRSDDNRRRSFDKSQRESQSSRYSLNTQGPTDSADYDLRYFISTSLSTEESRTENPDDSHGFDIDESLTIPSPLEGQAETDTLLEEPELENLTENDTENNVDCFHRCENIKNVDDDSRKVDDMMLQDWENVLKESERKRETILCIEDDEV